MQFRGGQAKASGAALTELVVLTMILVPLLFGTAMIGKYIDITQSAVMASRYAAWETTVHGDDAAPDDVRARFFDRPDRRAATDADGGGADVAANAPDAAGDDPSDADPSTAGIREQTRVRVALDGIGARTEGIREYGGLGDGTRRTESVAERFSDFIDSAGDAIGDWDVTVNGMTRSTVHVPLEGNDWVPGRALDERSVIMNGGWSASDRKETAALAGSFVPAGKLETVGDVVSAIGVIPVFKELEGLKGALGAVDASALPDNENRTLEPYPEEGE